MQATTANVGEVLKPRATTTNVFNIADYERFRWRKNCMALKDGTTGRAIPFDDSQKRRPTPAVTPATAHSQNRQLDHNTLPPIRIVKSENRLIPEGDYEAVCVKASHRWNYQFHRWEAILEFALAAPAPAGTPIPMHVRMGEGRDPELKDSHWLAQVIERLGGLEKLAGWRFHVTVQTIKRRPGDKTDRAPGLWYSRVKEAELWDDYALRSSKSSLL